MGGRELDDGVVRLCEWDVDDAGWYAESVRDPLIQQFTTDSPTLDAEAVLAAILRLRGSDREEGFVIRDSVTGQRLGNIALHHDGMTGEISYWVAADARGRGAATRAVDLFASWAFEHLQLDELWLRAHRDNIASQRVAVRAGFHRDPGRDMIQHAKGAAWPMLGYARGATAPLDLGRQRP